jgi:hypothetical protein
MLKFVEAQKALGAWKNRLGGKIPNPRSQDKGRQLQ